VASASNVPVTEFFRTTPDLRFLSAGILFNCPLDFFSFFSIHVRVAIPLDVLEFPRTDFRAKPAPSKAEREVKPERSERWSERPGLFKDYRPCVHIHGGNRLIVDLYAVQKHKSPDPHQENERDNSACSRLVNGIFFVGQRDFLAEDVDPFHEVEKRGPFLSLYKFHFELICHI